MTAKRFYDWQTAGGTDDVMRLVNCLERADIPWCAIGGVAVNHWAEEPQGYLVLVPIKACTERSFESKGPDGLQENSQ